MLWETHQGWQGVFSMVTSSDSSMMEIRSVTPDMFDEIYSLLGEFKIQFSQEEWKQIFFYPWQRSENHVGYALYENSSLIGYMGLIFSNRLLHGKIQKFCNITSWIIKPGYRHTSIAFITKLKELGKNYTLTNMTPSPSVGSILKEIGFKPLESNISIFSLSPNFLPFFKPSLSHTASRPDEFKNILNPADFQIYQDHALSTCHHLLTYSPFQYCYLIFKRHTQKGVPFNFILYLSDPNLFQKNQNQILWKMFKKTRSPLGIIDHRFLKRPFPFGIKYPLPSCRLFLSQHLKAHDIDNLYSEIALLPII